MPAAAATLSTGASLRRGFHDAAPRMSNESRATPPHATIIE
jgi:hypothetical protein